MIPPHLPVVAHISGLMCDGCTGADDVERVVWPEVSDRPKASHGKDAVGRAKRESGCIRAPDSLATDTGLIPMQDQSGDILTRHRKTSP